MRLYLILIIINIGFLQAYADQADLEVIQDCDVCPEMVVIKPGTFLMGRRPYEAIPKNGRLLRDMPAKQVTIDYRYAIGRYEITRTQYQACIDAGECELLIQPPKGQVISLPTLRKLPKVNPDTFPAIRMTWDKANQYVMWLSKHTGRQYEIPSEAEWEYAARGGTSTLFWWGDDIGKGNANCRACFFDKQFSIVTERYVNAVGLFKPNPFGLYDVAGNVSEVTSDCYHKTLENTPTNGTPQLTNPCMVRILKGGSAHTESKGDVRISHRTGYSERFPSVYRGLRVKLRLGNE